MVYRCLTKNKQTPCNSWGLFVILKKLFDEFELSLSLLVLGMLHVWYLLLL